MAGAQGLSNTNAYHGLTGVWNRWSMLPEPQTKGSRMIGQSGWPRGTGMVRDHLERAVRMHRSNTEAAAALGITPRALGRLCRRCGIDTPHARHRKAQEARMGDLGAGRESASGPSDDG